MKKIVYGLLMSIMVCTILTMSACSGEESSLGYVQSYQVPNPAVREIQELLSENVSPEKAAENQKKAKAVFEREYGKYFSEEGAEREWLVYTSELPYSCMAAGWSIELSDVKTRELKNGGETLEAKLTVTKSTGETEAVGLVCSVQLDENKKITNWKRTGSDDVQRLLLEALSIE